LAAYSKKAGRHRLPRGLRLGSIDHPHQYDIGRMNIQRQLDLAAGR
jgi:hypothetical protein